MVHAADIQDKVGGAHLLERFAKVSSRLRVIFADGAYVGETMANAAETHHDSRLQVVPRDKLKTFKVLPKRWIVERTFAWLDRNRRLSKDYEELQESSEAFLVLGMIRIIVGQLA